MQKTQSVCILYFFLLLMQAFCADPFAEGKRFFSKNEIAKALPLLIQASLAEEPDPAVFNYLGLSYYQLGQYTAAIESFERGAVQPGANRSLLFFNAGNAAFAAAKYELARDLYSKSLEENAFFTKALLNRGNTHVKMLLLPEAYADYKRFLELDPENPKREILLKLTSVLEADIKNAELEKLAAEQQKVQAETERRAAELAVVEAQRKALQAELDAQKAQYESQMAQMQSEKDRIAELEQTRVAEAQRREQQALQERAAAEKMREELLAKQAEENARKQAETEKLNAAKLQLLESISASLSSDLKNISAGTEGVIDYERKSELE